MYIPVPFCKFILRITSPAMEIEEYHLFKLNFKIKRSSTITTRIKAKYNLPTFVYLNFRFTRFITIIITK